MAYTSVKRTSDGAAVLQYVLSSEGHNGAERRNEIVTPINMCRSVPYLEQMNSYWKRARSNYKIQLVTIIQSFSKKEFDNENQNDILKANIIGQELVKRLFPNRQALVCTQIDGKGGYVHNHILISDVSMTDLKGCDKSQYHHYPIMSLSDKIVSEYTILDHGKKRSKKVSKKEKILTERNEYSYVDDIRNRVKKAILISESEDDFIKNLKLNGISAKKGKSKTHGDYLTYELVDLSNVPEGTKPPNWGFKKRSYKMGEEYSPEAIRGTNEILERVKLRQSEDSIADTESIPSVGQLSKENVNLPEEKVSELQAVPESEYELEPSIKKSAVPEEQDEKQQSEAAVTAVPTTDENAGVYAVVQQIINDDEEDKKETLHTVRKAVEPECAAPDNTAADGSKSAEISAKSTEVSNEHPNGEKAHTRKPASGNKASKNKSNTNNWGLSRLYKAMGLTSNVQPEQEDDELSR